MKAGKKDEKMLALAEAFLESHSVSVLACSYTEEKISASEKCSLWPFSHFLIHTEVKHITHSTPCYQFLLDINPLKDTSFINFLNVFHHFHFYLALFYILFTDVMFHSFMFWLSQTTKAASTDAFSWRND